MSLMKEKVFKAKEIDFNEKNDKIPLNFNEEKEEKKRSSVSRSHSSSFINLPLKKTNNIYSKILFPYDDGSRRNAHKYLENYSATKPDLNEDLLKYIKKKQKEKSALKSS